MSILIKGMEMPKKCLDCPFMVSRDNDDCVLQSDEANAKFNSWDDMKASCLLVEIPTPYGQLIDVDRTVDTEPKRGKWILKSYRWECDQCGCLIRRENPFKGNEWNYNYCPNCGAKMGVTE